MRRYHWLPQIGQMFEPWPRLETDRQAGEEGQCSPLGKRRKTTKTKLFGQKLENRPELRGQSDSGGTRQKSRVMLAGRAGLVAKE